MNIYTCVWWGLVGLLVILSAIAYYWHRQWTQHINQMEEVLNNYEHTNETPVR